MVIDDNVTDFIVVLSSNCEFETINDKEVHHVSDCDPFKGKAVYIAKVNYLPDRDRIGYEVDGLRAFV